MRITASKSAFITGRGKGQQEGSGKGKESDQAGGKGGGGKGGGGSKKGGGKGASMSLVQERKKDAGAAPFDAASIVPSGSAGSKQQGRAKGKCKQESIEAPKHHVGEHFQAFDGGRVAVAEPMCCGKCKQEYPVSSCFVQCTADGKIPVGSSFRLTKTMAVIETVCDAASSADQPMKNVL